MSAPSVEAMGLSPLCGTFIFMMLFGMTVTQVYNYYTYAQDRDTRWMKVLVGYVAIVETVHAAVSCHYIVWYFINRYGQPDALLEIPWSVPLSILLGFAVAWPVNQFFVWKIYILSKRKLWLAIIIGVLATLRPGFAYTACVLMYIYPTWGGFFVHGKFTVTAGLSVGLVVDWLICFAVTYYLRKGRKTVFKPTQNLINILIKYTIRTGGILFVFAILELTSALLMPNTLTFLGAFQIQIQLYANCFLTNLNARETIRRDLNPMISLGEYSRGVERSPQQSQHAGVEIKSETFITIDPTAHERRNERNFSLGADHGPEKIQHDLGLGDV